MKIAVYGLWHLGSVTAACMAEAGHDVTGLDPDAEVVSQLQQGRPPLFEPGLEDLVQRQSAAGRLKFTPDAEAALADADVLWVTFDTPVNERDEAAVDVVRGHLHAVVDHLRPGTIVLVSSQVPAGFTRSLETAWSGRGLRFAVSPENLRLGKALDVFRQPDRIVLGVRDSHTRDRLAAMLRPITDRIEWMSIESAEMTKHAINAFLATSVTFINELARLCESIGADAKEVERGLKSEARIGPKAYLAPGGAFAGGTLARDLRFLALQGREHGVETPLVNGVIAGNEAHRGWLRAHIDRLLAGLDRPVVTLLGLTYKPGTDTLRRSTAVELGEWLSSRGADVRAVDPAVKQLPSELSQRISLQPDAAAALAGSDLAVVTTEWPQFRDWPLSDLVPNMRRPRVIDPNHFLARQLGADERITYIATGKAA